MKQQAIKFQFREAKNRENYIVGDSNINAIKWIDKYPNWKNSGLIIEGPKASGKSHFVRVWQKKATVIFLKVNELIMRKLMLMIIKT